MKTLDIRLQEYLDEIMKFIREEYTLARYQTISGRINILEVEGYNVGKYTLELSEILKKNKDL